MSSTPRSQHAKDIFIEMHRLFKRLQQRNRYVDIEPQSQLSLAEAHLLKEIQAQPHVTLREFEKFFFLPQSHMSRLMNRLVERGFIQKKVSSADARALSLSLTPKGIKVIALSDAVSRESFETIGRLLTASEKKKLVQLFKAIADGFEHPTPPLRPGELEYSLHQRRITRCFRLLGKRVFESAFNSTQFQVLSRLAYSPLALSARVLADQIAVTNSAMTIVTKDLIKRGLLSAVSNTHDKRALCISITAAGQRAVDEVEHRAARRLQESLRDYSHRQIQDWFAVLKKYVLDSDEGVSVASLGLTTVLFSSSQELASARAKIITEIVLRHQQNECPETIAASHHIVVGFHRGKELVAIFDVAPQPKRFEVVAGYFEQNIPTNDRKEIVGGLRSYLQMIDAGAKLECAFAPLTALFASL
jgi:DNA-binding MarR family transcriptional regulator